MFRISWDLPAEAQHVRLCRNLTRAVLQHMKVEEKEIEELELAIGELCTNVVRHANIQSDRSYLVELEIVDSLFSLTVSDVGVGFTPQITEEPTPTESGGLGLWLVEQLTDHLEFHKAQGKGTVVHAERKLKTAA